MKKNSWIILGCFILFLITIIMTIIFLSKERNPFTYKPVKEIIITFDKTDEFFHDDLIITDKDEISSLVNPLKSHEFKNDNHLLACIITDYYRIYFDNGVILELDYLDSKEDSCVSMINYQDQKYSNILPQEFIDNLKDLLNKKNFNYLNE